MNKKSVKNLIGEEITKADPIGLISIGASNDEYNPEIQTIMAKSHLCKNVNDWERLLYETFVRMLDKKLAGQRKNYRNLANRIFDKIKSA